MRGFTARIGSLPWRRRVVLRRLAEGAVFREAAASAGVTRRTLQNWRKVDPEFSQLVDVARGLGEERRNHLLWLRHPFRGCRPPRGRRHGGQPRFLRG